MEPMNEVFLCLLLPVNSAGEKKGGSLHSPQLLLEGEAHLPRGREDSGMCVLSLPCRFPGSWFA